MCYYQRLETIIGQRGQVRQTSFIAGKGLAGPVKSMLCNAVELFHPFVGIGELNALTYSSTDTLPQIHRGFSPGSNGDWRGLSAGMSKRPPPCKAERNRTERQGRPLITIFFNAVNEILKTTRSGVGTGGSGGSLNRGGAPAPGAPE